ncbi:MAG: caspase family protein, partial [Bacteroidia bacterium]
SVNMPTNAIVKIDMAKKEAVADFAESYYPYDMRLKDKGKIIGIWYVKYDVGNFNANEKETVYSEYNTETGAELLTKTLVKTPDIIGSHYTSESGKYFALINPISNYFKVFDAKGDELIDLADLKIQIPKCFFIEELDRLIIVSTINSIATFVDLKQKKVTGQLANANSDNFFLITTDLHYLGSKEFVKNIRFKYQSEIYSFEQFDAYLNQPHQVLRAFGCSDSTLIQAYETAYLKRMRVLGLKPDSKLSFSALPSVANVQMREGKPGQVDFTISANKGKSDLSSVDVFNNGTLIYTEAIPAGQAAHYEKSLSFETSSGINRFEFILKDAQGLESPRTVRLYNNISVVKPNLYLVVIGSEKFKNSKFDLSYAVKDAGDVANTMANSGAFGQIEIKKLFNQSFSSDSVQALNAFFSKATINDVVMVFFAGHGYLDDDLSYYFPTYYTDFSDPKINSVAYKDFEKLFKNMKPTRKLMFIDACFSGEVDEDIYQTEDTTKSGKDKRNVRLSGSTFAQSTALELSKAVFSDLRQNTGATIISSAGGTEAAYEGETWNNGLFTHCLLDGLKSLKADQNADKKITLNELQKFVSEEVNKLSNGKQTPTYRVENTSLDYELW